MIPRVGAARAEENALRASTTGLIALLLAALGPASAQGAQAPTAGKSRQKIAVLDVRAVGTFDPKSIEGLSTLVASELSRHERVEVTSGADLRAMIGFDRERQLLGCTETSCLAEIGGALGVDYLLSPEVSQIGGVWLLTLSLLDVGKAKATKRITKRCDEEKGLVDAALGAVAEVAGALGTPERTTGVEPVVPAGSVTAESGGGGSAGSWLLLGGGAVLVGGGAYLLADAWTTYADWEAAQTNPAQNWVTEEDAASAELRAKIGWGLAGVGAAVATWGVVGLLSGGPETGPTVTVLPGPGGAAVLVSGSLP